MGIPTFFHETSSKFSVLADSNSGRAFCLTKRDFKLIAEKGRDLRNIKLLESLSNDQNLLFKTKTTIANFVKGEIFFVMYLNTILTNYPMNQVINIISTMPYMQVTLFCERVLLSLLSTLSLV